MGTRHNKRVVIAIDLAHTDGQRKLAGILRYVKSHHIRWDIRLKRRPEDCQAANVDEFPEWGIDGIIFSQSTAHKNTLEALEHIARLPIPLVIIEADEAFYKTGRKENVAIVSTDADSLGKTAADYFLGQGMFKSYGFVPDVLNRAWSQKRGESFRNALLAKGVEARMFTPKVPGGNDFKDLAQWLRKLPKPAGVFVPFDDRALSVIEACSAAGIAIPGEVSILSADDDELLCENCIPPLSSIRTDQERAGYVAGEMMTALFRSPGKRLAETLTGKTITHRESTLAATAHGKLVQRCLAYIRANARRRITADDAARHLKVSRKLIDLRFRQVLSKTVTQVIADERLDRVADLLTRTHLSIKEIADTCGFSDPFHLMHAFRRHYGRTMRQYRAESVEFVK